MQEKPTSDSEDDNEDHANTSFSEDDGGSSSGPEEEPYGSGKGKRNEKKDIARRKNKHAPMEMSSKRPVPRKKVAIEEKRPIPRDPRFLSITGEFKPEHFRAQYGFLADLHKQELGTLKENLKRARKMLITSPRDLREEREGEVQRLERAVKRAESSVNRDKKEQIEQSALEKIKQDERNKRKQGKKAWYMKNSDKRDMLTKAKFDALAESGGRGAVRKVIEKKQKKSDQKEKKKRPFTTGPGANRAHRGRDGAQPNKKRRLG